MFIVITEERSVGPCFDEFNALMESVYLWKDFNPKGLDEHVIQVIWSNDQVSFQYQDTPSCY